MRVSQGTALWLRWHRSYACDRPCILATGTTALFASAYDFSAQQVHNKILQTSQPCSNLFMLYI